MNKYEEALERARKECNAYAKDTTAHRVLKRIFPELAESEDERIRKELIGYAGLKLKYFTEANSKNDIDKKNQKWWKDVLAYLEKQKEQKSLNIGAASEWLRKHVDIYMNSEYNEFHKCVEYDGSIDKERLINDFEEAMQKEQKTSSYSHLEITNVVRRALQECEGFRNYRSDVYAARVGATVETLLQEQKSTAEETELNSIAFLEQLGYTCIPPEAEQKLEWTIEDAKPGDIVHISSTASSDTFIFKGIRNDEHGSVECFCAYDSEDGFREGEYHFIGWKSDKYTLATPRQCAEFGRAMGRAGYIFHFNTNQLQKIDKPHWKPSEEQMIALKRSIGYLADYGTSDDDLVLDALYNDLKKL